MLARRNGREEHHLEVRCFPRGVATLSCSRLCRHQTISSKPRGSAGDFMHELANLQPCHELSSVFFSFFSAAIIRTSLAHAASPRGSSATALEIRAFCSAVT